MTHLTSLIARLGKWLGIGTVTTTEPRVSDSPRDSGAAEHPAGPSSVQETPIASTIGSE